MRPIRLQHARGADSRPLVAREHGDEIALAHRADVARYFFRRRIIHVRQTATHRRRTHHARMQHAGQLEIVHIGERAVDFRRNINALHGFADEAVALWILDACLGIKLERKILAADELRIRHRAPIGLQHHGAIFRGELLCGHVEQLRGLGDQRRARGRGSPADFHAAARDRHATRSGTLIGREQRIAFDHGNALQRHVEFLGGNLHERCAHAGAQINLAGINRHRAIRPYSEKAIHLADGKAFRWRERLRRCIARQRERNHQRTTSGKKLTPIQSS